MCLLPSCVRPFEHGLSDTVRLLVVLRLASLWEEEQRAKGSEASLCSVVWSFCRTRLLLSILCLTVTQLAGFSGPAFVVKRLLEYTQQDESNLGYGLLLVLGLLTTELIRSWSLALTWALNYRTGTRVRGAILSLAFNKILRLRSVRDQSMGQVLVWTLCFLYSSVF